MSTILEAPARDVRESAAIGYLRPALDEALDRQRPVFVSRVPTSLGSKELVALAVRLCRHVEANVAVLANPSGRGVGVIFTPLG